MKESSVKIESKAIHHFSRQSGEERVGARQSQQLQSLPDLLMQPHTYTHQFLLNWELCYQYGLPSLYMHPSPLDLLPDSYMGLVGSDG